MKLALVADWLVTFGGAEHVLAELRTLYPDAPIFTTVRGQGNIGALEGAPLHLSRLQKFYRCFPRHQLLLPWLPSAIEGLDVRGYDVLLSSSHVVGKGIVPPSTALHICYCHTPVRYAWEMEEQYLEDFRVPRWLRPLIRRRLRDLRRWDLTTAKRVDVFIANSTTVQTRIKETYDRESVVIAPPVEERFFGAISGERGADSKKYFLAVGRLVPYKRFDLLIEMANRLQLPLVIAGRGQDEARLRRMAGPTVTFLGFVAESDLPLLYKNAGAFLFPQHEDAGVVLLEAQASGTPAIAYRAGGAIDVIREGKTGIFFEQQTIESLCEAMQRFASHHWDRAAIQQHTRTFSQERFRTQMAETVSLHYAAFRAGTLQRR